MSLFGFTFYLGYLTSNKTADKEPNTASKEISQSTNRVGSMSTKTETYHIQEVQTVLPENIDIHALLKLKSEFSQYKAMYLFSSELTEFDTIKYLKQVKQLDDDHAITGLSKILFSRFVEINGEHAVNYFFDSYAGQEQYKSLIFEIFHEWAFYEPGKTALSVENIENKQLQHEVILSLITASVFEYVPDIQQLADLLPTNLKLHAEHTKVMNRGYIRAFEYYLTLDKNDPKRNDGIRRAMYKWALVDPITALLRVNDLDDKQHIENIQTMIISMLANSDSQLAVEQAILLDSLDDKKNNKRLMLVIEQIASKNGKQAFEYALAHKDLLGDKANMRILSNWAQKDPRAAAQYWQDVLGLNKKREAYGIAMSYADKYPQEAFEWAYSLNLPNNILLSMANSFARNDLTQAKQYFQTIDSPKQRAALLTSIVQHMSGSDIREARQWLLQFEDEKGFAVANDRLIHNWIRQDPAGVAADYIINDTKNTKYINALIHSWYNTEPDNTRYWVMSLEPGKLRDQALSTLILKIGRDNLDLAFDLLKSVSDEHTYRNLEAKLQNLQ